MIKYPHHYGFSRIQQRLPNHYTYQKLWLADDLSASISSRTDIGYESDNGKIVLSVGVIDTHCTLDFLRINMSNLSLLSGARCQREAWAEMYNNTSTASPWSGNNRLTDQISDLAQLAAALPIRALLPGKLIRNIVECTAIATRLDQHRRSTIPVYVVRGLLDPPAGALQMTQDPPSHRVSRRPNLLSRWRTEILLPS